MKDNEIKFPGSFNPDEEPEKSKTSSWEGVPPAGQNTTDRPSASFYEGHYLEDPELVNNQERYRAGMIVPHFVDFMYESPKLGGSTQRYEKYLGIYENLVLAELVKLFNESTKENWHADPDKYRAINKQINRKIKNGK